MSLKKLRKYSLPNNIERAILDFAGKVKRTYPDAEIYLFGSYAKGTWIEDSDIDLVVISRHFNEMSMERRIRILRNMASKKHPFQILAYTPDEFQKLLEKSIALQDAREYWIKIA